VQPGGSERAGNYEALREPESELARQFSAREAAIRGNRRKRCSLSGLNGSGKRGSAAMLFIIIGVLGVSLSYVFVQAVHHVDPNAQPRAPLHDPR